MSSPHPTTPKVSLQPVTPENREHVLALRVTELQQKFVARNARTLEQADSAPEAWLRAIYADDTMVGLLLLHDEHLRTPPREQGYYYLWRLMIDVAHQRKGYGHQAIDLVLKYVSTRPHAKRLLSSYIPGDGGPEKFYQNYGFKPTGNMIEEDVEIEFPIKTANTLAT